MEQWLVLASDDSIILESGEKLLLLLF